VALFSLGFFFVYLLIILHLPINFPKVTLILISFMIGIIVDIFYHTGGIHTMGTTFIGFLRPIYIRAITPVGGYDENVSPTLQIMGPKWYFVYILPLIFLFSFVFFLVDQWGTSHGLWLVLKKSIFSSILTSFLAILIQSLGFRKSKNGI
jgi:hypothetical protein